MHKHIALLSLIAFTSTTFSMEKDCNPVKIASEPYCLDKNETRRNDNNNKIPAQRETKKPIKHLERFDKHYYLLELCSQVRSASLRE